MSLDMSQFHGLFFEETEHHLAAMEEMLSSLDPERIDLDVVAEAYRFAHSIKGASATFSFDEMAELGRALVGVLDRARAGDIAISERLVSVCRDARRILSEQMATRRDGHPVSIESGRDVCIRLAALVTSPSDAADLPISAADAAMSAAFDLRFRISRAAVASDMLVEALLEQLATLGTVAVVVRPQGGGAGEWRIGLRSTASERDLRAVLELLVEPGSLHIALRGEARATVLHPDEQWKHQAAIEQSGKVGESSSTRDRMATLARQIRESSVHITTLAGQMEALSARHAVLLEEAAELTRRFAREAQQAGVSRSLAEGGNEIQGAGRVNRRVGTKETSEKEVPAARHRPSVRSPLPKIKRSNLVRADLAEEWEEC